MRLTSQVFFIIGFLIASGCEPTMPALGLSSDYTPYAPVKVDIMPLTEFTRIEDIEEQLGITVYVSLLDTFDCQAKWPGVFRFELYKRLLHSTKPKGKRIATWSDIDLTSAAENNNYWRDFLRAYEFNLDFEPQSTQDYILQVTCQCPRGKRLSSEIILKSKQ